MRKAIFIAALAATVCLLGGCDFFRVLAGRPTSREIENKRKLIGLDAEGHLLQDSLLLQEQAVAPKVDSAAVAVDSAAVVADSAALVAGLVPDAADTTRTVAETAREEQTAPAQEQKTPPAQTRTRQTQPKTPATRQTRTQPKTPAPKQPKKTQPKTPANPPQTQSQTPPPPPPTTPETQPETQPVNKDIKINIRSVDLFSIRPDFRYYVAIGTFGNQENANRQGGKAGAAGYPVDLLPLKSGATIVAVCGTNDLSIAESSLGRIRTESFCPKDAWILNVQ